ncbi:MAG TPA: putative sulfate exporter family transporter, partial [Arthrobacter sp.]|nr:putative sulfate exporter family transporter [Arthrobacter sp.]
MPPFTLTPLLRADPLPRLLPGLLSAAAAVVLALTVHRIVPVLPAMTLAVAFGLLAANVPGLSGWTAGRGRPGLDFA